MPLQVTKGSENVDVMRYVAVTRTSNKSSNKKINEVVYDNRIINSK